LSLTDVRQGGQYKIAETLLVAPRRTVFVVNAARLGMSPIPPITARQLRMGSSVGGLIIAGSYNPKFRRGCGGKCGVGVFE